MDHRDWVILKVLYEKKNITKAAESLFLAQPSLTNRLQHIEKEFGVPVVIRGRRGVQFTPQGEYLVKVADEVLKKTAEAKEHLMQLESCYQGTLRIAATNTFTHYKLPILLKSFKEHYPHVELKVITKTGQEIIQLLNNQEVHLAFIRGDYYWPHEKKLLLEEEIFIASKEKISQTKLPSLPQIAYNSDYTLKPLLDNWWATHFTDPPFISIEVSKIETCKEMVVNGLGYAFIPGMVIENTDNIYKLPLLDQNGNPYLRRTWFLYHEETLKNSIVKAFAEFVEKNDFQG